MFSDALRFLSPPNGYWLFDHPRQDWWLIVGGAARYYIHKETLEDSMFPEIEVRHALETVLADA
jgi:hypothetical protein